MMPRLPSVLLLAFLSFVPAAAFSNLAPALADEPRVLQSGDVVVAN